MFKKISPRIKVTFRYAGVLHVFIIGKTTNQKVAMPKQVIVQHYAYSRAQFDWAKSSKGWVGLFTDDRDKDVCLDCPLSGMGGKCYTHKPMQASGFLSSLRSLPDWSDILPYDENYHVKELVRHSNNRFVRFGTYGEPALLPLEVVESICSVAKKWTAYTHQWRKFPIFKQWFMASTESIELSEYARSMGWRTFASLSNGTMYDHAEYIHCPASKEKDFSAVCSGCGLCNGASKKRDVVIWTH